MNIFDKNLSFAEQGIHPSDVFLNISRNHFALSVIGKDAHVQYLVDMEILSIAQFCEKYFPGRNYELLVRESKSGITNHYNFVEKVLKIMCHILHKRYNLGAVPEERKVYKRGLSRCRTTNEAWDRSTPRIIPGWVGANKKTHLNPKWWRDLRFELKNPGIFLGAFVYQEKGSLTWHYYVEVNDTKTTCANLENLRDVFLKKCELYKDIITIPKT